MGKGLIILRGEIKTPPLSKEARREVGFLLRMLQEGESLSMPHARPMPGVGPRCLELRVNDAGNTWRAMCRIDPDAVIVVDVFDKKTRTTPDRIVQECRRRLRLYDEATGD
jgi:phage-related protein